MWWGVSENQDYEQEMQEYHNNTPVQVLTRLGHIRPSALFSQVVEYFYSSI